jgi:hypothetical protein
MSNNVVALPFDDLSELDVSGKQREDLLDFIGKLNDWCHSQGIDITTKEYRHQAAVIMTVLQGLQMKVQ